MYTVTLSMNDKLLEICQYTLSFSNTTNNKSYYLFQEDGWYRVHNDSKDLAVAFLKSKDTLTEWQKGWVIKAPDQDRIEGLFQKAKKIS